MSAQRTVSRREYPVNCCTELVVFGCVSQHSHIGCHHVQYVSKEWLVNHCLNLRSYCPIKAELKNSKKRGNREVSSE